MTNVVIAGYARSPFHLAGKGDLARVRPDDLAAQTIRGLLDKTGVDPAAIEDIILGCAFPEGEQGLNVARMIGLLADLPLSVGGMTVNRFCGSSMSAIHIAVGQINIGAGDAFICAGLESMSRVPMGGYNPLPNPDLFKKNAGAYMGMGETAENVARDYQITRAEQDAFAVKSQDKAAAARADGVLADRDVDRARRRAAEAGDRRAADRQRQIGEQADHPRDVQALFALGEGAAEDDVLDFGGIDAGLVEQPANRLRREIVGADAGEVALAGKVERRAGVPGDDDVGHDDPLQLQSVRLRLAGYP